jgi:anthranilate synthase component 1
VDPGFKPARFAFIAFDPIEEIRIPRRGDPHRTPRLLSEYLASFRLRFRDASDLPFYGAITGYLGHEYVGLLEKIPAAGVEEPQEAARIFIFRNIILLDSGEQRMSLLTHVFPDRDDAADVAKNARESLARITRILASPSPRELALIPGPHARRETPTLAAGMGRAKFVDTVKEAKKRIRAGDIFQCVISDRFEGDFAGDPLALYQALRTQNPSPYHYYLDLGDAALLGASPERLVSLTGDRLVTSPIAGTRHRGATPAEEARLERALRKSPKENSEHVMLVDLGRNDLGRISRPGTVKVEAFAQVERFSHVMHLVSRVSGEAKRGIRPLDALTACFPAGTLTGAPKISAMKIISELEPVARGPYGGAILFQDFRGNLDSCICIRSAFIREGRIRLQAGAGIVADSNPDREYEEVLRKIAAVKTAYEGIAACGAPQGRQS